MPFDLIQTSALAFIQGFTEFLPISSSAHLILPSALLGWQDQGLTFDIAVHLGSLLAVVAYFRKDVLSLFTAFIASLAGKGFDDEAKLAWLLLLASIPGGLAGLALMDLVENSARALPVIATTSFFFALVLLMADRRGTGSLTLRQLNWRHALLIGAAQALALIPGTSRSGITMSAALICNLSRESAARFSFLLAIPIILASAALKIRESWLLEFESQQWLSLSYAAVFSCIVAYACIHYFLKLIERVGFLPFVIYRIALSAVLFGIIFLA